MGGSFDRELAAARAAYERNDPYGALRRLDRARQAALRGKDVGQLQHVLEFAGGVIARDERTEIERENVVYAARQNVRQVTRRLAWERGAGWSDPFPKLDPPRTYLSTGVKVWIGVGVALGTALVVLWLASPFLD